MAKAYIVIKGQGAYTDRSAAPVRVYLDEQRARAAIAALQAITDKFAPLLVIGQVPYQSVNHEEAQRLNPQIKAEYAALGFDADWASDWELVEAEIED